MIIVLKPEASPEVVREILAKIEACGLKPLSMPGSERTVLGALGNERVLAALDLEGHPMVESVKPILSPYKLVSRELVPHDTVVALGDETVGGHAVAVVAGPYAVEGIGPFREVAERVKAAGGTALLGNAYKPRTNPYDFGGIGAEAIEIAASVAEEVGLPLVMQVFEPEDVDRLGQYAHGLMVGARNMQSFRLLSAVGKSHLPVILRRGVAARLDDLLLAAEHIVGAGNPNVILCERGIRTFETATRNTLDLAAIPYLKSRSHLPVVVDPSEGVGLRDLVTPMARAAVAAGADGLMIQVRPETHESHGGGPQPLYPDQLDALMAGVKAVAAAVGRTLGGER